MALDRNRILNELGSVMNQLQSADCGCMGKLFGQPGQCTSPSSLPACGGCQRNCCYGHGYGWNSSGSCGEPYQGKPQNMYTPCMGRCNPPKLYSDTYNYLTDNLIRPTIKEVYDDLKGLTPDNTIVNNPIAKQMGLSPNTVAAQGNMGDMSMMNVGNMGSVSAGNMGTISTGNKGNANADNMGNMGFINTGKVGNMNTGNIGNVITPNDYNNFNGQLSNVGYMPTNEMNQNDMREMGGMGPQIMNMIGGHTKPQSKANPNMGKNVQLTQPMQIDTPQSPHNHITPLPAAMRANQDVYNNQGGHNVNPGTMQSNIPAREGTQNTGHMSSAAHQMASGHHFGPHSKGIAKFNEMFPGVIKNVGGDLGFDPMAIAIQMNPANQQQAAIDSMNKLMQSNNIGKVFDPSARLMGSGVQQNQTQNSVPPNQVQKSMPLQQVENETVQSNATSPNQMAYQNIKNYENAVNDNVNVYGSQNAQLNSQQAYSASVPNQQINQANQQQYPIHQENIIDPNTDSEMAPPTLSSAYPESQNIQRVIKEPIFPVDTSRYVAPKQPKYFGFNTLGQPVEKTSAEIYRTPEPSLPQTLSPQPQTKSRADAAKYAKVKSTVSKTSLMGAKALGRTTSQLQHIYNQYKGSQSFTQQNIPAQGVNAVTHSEGKLNAPQINQNQRQMPVESIGGDTMANNQVQDRRMVQAERMTEQIGDVPTTAVKPTEDAKLNEMAPVINRYTRNGLQDMIYTSYPSSAAWTFHGGNTRPYSPPRGRYRGRYR